MIRPDHEIAGATPVTQRREEMFSYYEARAAEHDEVYVGKGPAIAALSAEYRADTAGVSRLLASFGRGHVVDLACGTAFWLPSYGPNCAQVTLIDQSADVLAECRRRVEELGLAAKTEIIRGDLFNLPLAASTYDGAVVGFFLSHLTDAEIQAFFRRLRTILKPNADLAVIDSLWSESRKPYREKEGFEDRVLNDGRPFKVYKRYFERPDVDAMLQSQGFRPQSTHAGSVFIAAISMRVASMRQQESRKPR